MYIHCDQCKYEPCVIGTQQKETATPYCTKSGWQRSRKREHVGCDDGEVGLCQMEQTLLADRAACELSPQYEKVMGVFGTGE